MVFGSLLTSLILMVAASAIQYALQPRPEKNNAVVGKMDVPTAEAGKTVPIVFGTMLIKDSNVIDYFDARTDPITSGKKGKK